MIVVDIGEIVSDCNEPFSTKGPASAELISAVALLSIARLCANVVSGELTLSGGLVAKELVTDTVCAYIDGPLPVAAMTGKLTGIALCPCVTGVVAD
jgi:hypothetical protein